MDSRFWYPTLLSTVGTVVGMVLQQQQLLLLQLLPSVLLLLFLKRMYGEPLQGMSIVCTTTTIYVACLCVFVCVELFKKKGRARLVFFPFSSPVCSRLCMSHCFFPPLFFFLLLLLLLLLVSLIFHCLLLLSCFCSYVIHVYKNELQSRTEKK